MPITLSSKRPFSYFGVRVKGEKIPIESRIIRVLADLAHLESKKSARFKGLELLREQKGLYDPPVMEVVGRYFELELQTANASTQKAPLALEITGLHAGHVLTGDIRTKQDILIVGGGTKITPLILERLRNFASLEGLKLPIYVEASPEE